MMQQPLLNFQAASTPRRLISLTPLIDVVFILLVFFMLASNFTVWSSINVSVSPISEVQGFDEKESMLLEVSESEIRFNNKVIEKSNIAERIFSHLHVNPEAILHIRPKADAQIQLVIEMFDIMQREGISNFTLVPDPEWKTANQ